MKTQTVNLLRSLAFIAAILLVFAAALYGILSLNHSADEEIHGEFQAHIILENCNALNALQWETIATGKIDAGVITDIRERRIEVDDALNDLEAQSPADSRPSDMRQAFDRYKKATDEEFALISAGRITEALIIDEELVDPAFERLTRLTIQVAISRHEGARSNNAMAAYLIVLISLLAAVTTGVLFWLYTSVLGKHRQIIFEKAVLERSEERFRSVAQTASEAIITIDEFGKVIYWNTAATNIFGYEEDEALGKDISFIMPGDYRDAHLAGLKQLVATEETKVAGGTKELYGLRKDGSKFPLELSLSSWQTRQGSFFTAIIHDITKRKQAEEKVVSQSKALEQRHVQLVTLYEVSTAISGTIELQEILDNALEKIMASGVLQIYRAGGILLANDNKLNLVSHLGHSEEFLALHKEIDMGQCLCGLAMERGEIIISEDSGSDDRHSIHYPGMEPHGHVIVPLKAKDKVLGVLYLYTPPCSAVNEERMKLFATIGGQLGVAIENARLFKETRELSLHDPLTGLANRSLMNIELRKNFVISRRKQRPLSLIMLDLDHFKAYNDTYGHPAGDQLLVDIAAIITSQMRETDLVVRYGGEEFLIILQETDSPTALQIAERVRITIMETGFFFAGQENPCHITVSLGLVTYDQTVEIESEDRIIVMADKALYHAKNAGRNRVEVYRRPPGGDFVRT